MIVAHKPKNCARFLKAYFVLFYKTKKYIVNQSGWLESCVVALTTKASSGQAPQFVVNKRHQFMTRSAVSKGNSNLFAV